MKEILFIAPSFYGYYKDIINELEIQGYSVSWYNDQVPQNYYIKFLRKYNPIFFEKIMNKYIDNIIRENENKSFDYVILILGYDFSVASIKRLLSKFYSAKSVYYTWDSISTYPRTESFLSLFDKSYTFDRVEALRYGIKLLPLYYKERCDYKKNILYDYSTVMSYYPNKDKNLRLIYDSMPKGLTGRTVLFVKSRLYYVYMKLAYPTISFKMKDMTYRKMSNKEVIDIFCSSRAVIDSPIINQHGLTMRTFEVLSNNVKLITTNSDIKYYDFYSPENIYIVEHDKKIPASFFDSPFDKSYGLQKKYSIKCFVQTLLGIENEEYIKEECI